MYLGDKRKRIELKREVMTKINSERMIYFYHRFSFCLLQRIRINILELKRSNWFFFLTCEALCQEFEFSPTLLICPLGLMWYVLNCFHKPPPTQFSSKPIKRFWKRRKLKFYAKMLKILILKKPVGFKKLTEMRDIPKSWQLLTERSTGTNFRFTGQGWRKVQMFEGPALIYLEKCEF